MISYPVSVDAKPFGNLSDGREITLYTLKSTTGAELDVMNYGGTVCAWRVPIAKISNPTLAQENERAKNEPVAPRSLVDIVIGFPSVHDYEKNPYYGALIGRVGNRIAFGKFELNGTKYDLHCNNFPGNIPCSLHGGKVGFNAKIWDATPQFIDGNPALLLSLISPDGDEYYPGTLCANVTYILDGNDWKIFYSASSDKTTLFNPTQHAYFNLKGEGQGNAMDHTLQLKASHYTPVNKGLIPLGHLDPVYGTPFDFTSPCVIGQRIDADNEQLNFGAGYDHNWVIDRPNDTDQSLIHAGTLAHSTTGRSLEVWTTEPAVQMYAGNWMPEDLPGKTCGNGRRYGIALETQHCPDAINHPSFTSIILEPGTFFASQTEYRYQP